MLLRPKRFSRWRIAKSCFIGIWIPEAFLAELIRRGYDITVGRVREKEIDFVCDKDGNRTFVQVSYLLATEAVKDREYGALDALTARGRRILLSMDRMDTSTDTVEHHYIPDWLAGSGGEGGSR